MLSWLGQFGFIAVGLLLVAPAVLAWSGRWRSWANAQPFGFALTKTNYFPLSAGLFGQGLVFFGLSLNAEFGIIPGSKDVYDTLGYICCALMLVSLLWWPAALTPGWHRDWIQWGGPDATDPWPTAEEHEEGRR